MGCKQIVSEICLQGLTLPRLLKIPEPANAPETDILNIQFSVLDLLAMDSEIQHLTNNLWNLGFDISAFNTQKQAWDVLGVDTQVYLPEGARVKITLKAEETIAVPPPRTRDPRKSAGKAQMGTVANSIGVTAPSPSAVPMPPSKRDPRRKPVSVAEQEGPRVARRDPRVKRKESEEAVTASVEEVTEQTGNMLQSMKALPLPVDPDAEIRGVSVEVESDSDEGNLHIDESFDEGAKTVKAPQQQEEQAPTIILESQLARLQTTEAPDDSAGLWDEIYGIGEERDGNEKAKRAEEKETRIGVKKEADEEEVTIVAEMNQLDLRVPSVENMEEQPTLKIRTSVKKTPEQLETEKQLLLKLVEERERLKATLAEAGVPDIPMEAKEVEEGELSDSSDSDEEESKKSKPNLFSPASPEPETNSKPDFFSPESPKVIELDDEEEVHVIPLEREDGEEDRFKKYWDDFPEEDSITEKVKLKTNTSSKTGDLRALIEKKIMDKVVSEKKLEVTIANEMAPKKSSAEVVIAEAPSLSFWKGSSGLTADKKDEKQLLPDRSTYVGPLPPPPPPIRKFLLEDPPAPYLSPAPGSMPPFPLIPPKAPHLIQYHDLPDKIQIPNSPRSGVQGTAAENRSSKAENAQGRRNNEDRKSETRSNRDCGDSGRREGRRRRRSRSSSRSRSRSRERGGPKSHSRQDRGHQRGPSWKSKDNIERREKKGSRWQREASDERSSTFASTNSTSKADKNTRSEDALQPKAVSEKERHDNAMLCFYEGADCLDDPGEAPLFPEPVPAVSKAPAAPSPSPSINLTSPPAPYPYFKPGGMDLTRVHPITAVHELCRRIGCGAPLWHERMVSRIGAGTWAFDVTVAGVRHSMPGSAREKKDAQRDGARNCLAQLGIISCYGKS